MVYDSKHCKDSVVAQPQESGEFKFVHALGALQELQELDQGNV